MKRTKLYKIAGPVIKISIIILAFGFIFREVFLKKDLSDIYCFFLEIISNTSNLYLLSIAVLLMPLNWGIETLKWQFLIKRIETVSFLRSFMAVLTGVTVSSFTPNRVGEYGGRVFVLEPENRWQGVILTVVGSFAQILTTLIAGLIAFLFFYPAFEFSSIIEVILIAVAFTSIVVLLLFYFYVAVFYHIISKVNFLKRTLRYLAVLKSINKNDLLLLLMLSIVRYIVFSLQFFLLLKICGLCVTFYESIMLTSMVFFILAAIPTIALSEFGVRGSVSIFIFGLFYTGFAVDIDMVNLGVVSAAFFLWVINLAIPALTGAFFVFRLKFFTH